MFRKFWWLVCVGFLVGCGGGSGITTPVAEYGSTVTEAKLHRVHRHRPKRPKRPPTNPTGSIVVVGPWAVAEKEQARKFSHLPALVKRIVVWVERDGRQEGSRQTLTPEEPKATFASLLIGKKYIVKGEGFDSDGRKVATGESEEVVITEFPRTVTLFLDDPRSSLGVEIRFKAH